MSNADVLQKAHARPLSSALLERQLLFFGRIAGSSNEDVIRRSIFLEGSCEIRSVGLRKRGRPRATWANKLYAEAVRVAGSKEALAALLQQANRTSSLAWERLVRGQCY